MLDFLMGRAKLRFRVGTSEIIGDRESQQDSYDFTLLEENHTTENTAAACVVALADGVGGGAAGDVASRLAVEQFLSSMNSQTVASINEQAFLDAIHAGNDSIAAAVNETPGYNGMATTLVGVVIDEAGMKWISVGDSHLYIIRKSKISKLNEDHSMGAAIDKEYELGHISKREAEEAPYRNVILSCLSGEPIEMIDVHHEAYRLKPGDRILIASDGLDTLSRLEVLEIGRRVATAQQCAQELTQSVLEKKKPHQDNTTVIVVDCLAK
jgi:protein phosphatase